MSEKTIKAKKAKITDLIQDEKNFNKGTEFGDSLIEKSFRKFGAGRSVLLDKNNRLIAGNKSSEKFGALGGEDVIIVDADKNTLVAVRRNDIDLDTPEGREFALADNQTAKVNIDFDFEVLDSELDAIVLDDWGIDVVDDKSNQRRVQANNEDIYLNIKCLSERDAELLYTEMISKGYECKIIS